MDKPELCARSGQWPRVRDEWLKINPTCAACGGTKNLEVHHIYPTHIFPERELAMDNLITLCMHPARLCHYRIGHAGQWRGYVFAVVKDAALHLKRVKESNLRAQKAFRGRSYELPSSGPASVEESQAVSNPKEGGADGV